jgi:alpha-L-arabinofuranosidase
MLKQFALCALAALSGVALAQDAKITIDVDQPTIKVSPMLYGIFFEEINRSGEGGLFAEMIQNRSFEDAKDATPGWTMFSARNGEGAISLDTSQPPNARNPHALRIENKRGHIGAMNEGFNGIPVKIRQDFVAKFHARADKGFNSPIFVHLENTLGRVLASSRIENLTGEWKQYSVNLHATDADSAARLVIHCTEPGTFFLDMVSLVPKNNWGKDPLFRDDLATLIANMKPAFMRFPGGCWVEGDNLSTSFRWKDTIGPMEQRKSNWNIWRYMCGNYVGYHEYLQFCEDIGAEPLFVINCGMSHREVVPLDKMGEYVQDALDAIEYANGPESSKWGSLRAKAGHPKPFNLKLMQIGNENGHQEYDDRYTLFYDAIKKQYPEVTLLACNWQGTKPTQRPIEVLDEHYYETPQFFINNANRYDTYDRKGPQIYVGEYAVTRGCAGGNLRAAIGEAAFMVGMERNSDIVKMASYAPLLANAGYKVWHPNAISFDNSRSYGTPSYYVQALFANHRPDQLVKIDVQATPNNEPLVHAGQIGLGTWDTEAEFKDIKVTSPDGKVLLENSGNTIEGWNSMRGRWEVSDGAIHQSVQRGGCYLVAGDPVWKDYTITLKARKIAGREGFLIRFHSADNDDFAMLNLGGWGNTGHQIQFNDGSPNVPAQRVRGSIETGKWYDIKLEVSQKQLRAYLNGEKIIDTPYPTGGRQSLFAVSGKTGDELILKLVNVSSQPQDTLLKINGVSSVQDVKEIQLTGSPDDENSLEHPTRVYPKSRSIDVTSSELRVTFPGNSVTILRGKVK